MLEIKNFHKSFDERTLFNNLNLTFKPNELTVIMGESGSGKTTLLSAIGMLEEIKTGKLVYNQQELIFKNRQTYFKDILGFVFQNYGLSENDTILQNIQYSLTKKDFNSLSTDQLNKMLGEFGIKRKCSDYIYSLSGGEQQRVALFRAMLKSPKVLLCDEPTGNLDEENSIFIMNRLKQYALQGNIVIVVTHDELFLKYSHSILRLK